MSPADRLAGLRAFGVRVRLGVSAERLAVTGPVAVVRLALPVLRWSKTAIIAHLAEQERKREAREAA